MVSFDDDAGWVALPGFLTEADVAQTQAICDELLRLPASERHVRDKPHSGTRHLAALDDRSDFINSIVARAELTTLIRSIIGPVFRSDEVAYRCPQPSFGGQKLHADDTPQLSLAPTTVATAIITLTAFTAINGATRLVPGSHRRVDLQRLSGSLANHPDERILTGSAGTAFVFSGHVLHSGTPNRSPADRPALHFVWRR